MQCIVLATFYIKNPLNPLNNQYFQSTNTSYVRHTKLPFKSLEIQIRNSVRIKISNTEERVHRSMRIPRCDNNLPYQ